MTTTKLYEFDYEDYFVEIHYSPNIKKLPYLVRIHSWSDDFTEIRMEKDQLESLPQLLESLSKENG